MHGEVVVFDSTCLARFCLLEHQTELSNISKSNFAVIKVGALMDAQKVDEIYVRNSVI